MPEIDPITRSVAQADHFPVHVGALTGPAFLETTTVVVNESDRLTVNGLGWLDIRLGGTA